MLVLVVINSVVTGAFFSSFNFTPQLQFYSSPLLKRDCPHFVRMKRRVGIKSALRQAESRPEALGIPPAPVATKTPEELPTSHEDRMEPASSLEFDSPTAPGQE